MAADVAVGAALNGRPEPPLLVHQSLLLLNIFFKVQKDSLPVN